MSSIERAPSGRWRARYRDAEGRQHCRTFDLKAQARLFLDGVGVAKARGIPVGAAAEKTTVGDLGPLLIAGKADRRNREWYEWVLRCHVYPRWEHVPVRGISHLHVAEWVNEQRSTRGPDTVRGAFRALHEIVGLARRARLIDFDPLDGIALPPVDRREMLFLTPAQVARLASVVERRWPDHGWGLLVRFAAYTGCRAGEIGGLRVDHLDLEGHRAKISLSRKPYGVDGSPKSRRPRWVGLPAQLSSGLASHTEAGRRRRGGRVWTGEGGDALNHHWFSVHRFKPVVDELSTAGELPVVDTAEGPATLRFHDLRHTCVAILIGQGAQQYEVMDQLGHTNIQTTINTYGHMFPAVHARIRVALETAWEAGSSESP